MPLQNSSAMSNKPNQLCIIAGLSANIVRLELLYLDPQHHVVCKPLPTSGKRSVDKMEYRPNNDIENRPDNEMENRPGNEIENRPDNEIEYRPNNEIEIRPDN